MGNFFSTKAEIQNYIKARTPLIIIESAERERVERMLKEISAEMNLNILYYTDEKQVCSLDGEQSINVDGDPLQYIASSFKKNRKSIFAYGDIKRISDDNAHSREVLNILYLVKEMGSTLILVTADNVWSRLAHFGMLTVLGHPDIDERLTYIEAFLSLYNGRFPIEWDYSDLRKAATLLRGFTEIQIENILSTTMVANEGLYKSHLFELTKQKSRLYPSIASVQMVNINQELEVAGLDALKDWLKDKQQIFFASDEALKERDLDTPKGILLTGIPGCGKSYSAKMIAKEWELPLFRFDLGTIYDKWVGESEKKMKEALKFIDNVSPCILWIDEIEKALAISDSGNDTGKHVLGQFLFWLQESKSRVFLVATANDVALLPFELFRKGRFSEVVFIDLPNEVERKEAIAQYARRSLHIEFNEVDMNELIGISEGFSYSDIEYAIKSVAQLALINGQHIVARSLVVETFNSIIPIAKSNPDMVSRIREWGQERGLAASYKPGGIRA